MGDPFGTSSSITRKMEKFRQNSCVGPRQSGIRSRNIITICCYYYCMRIIYVYHLPLGCDFNTFGFCFKYFSPISSEMSHCNVLNVCKGKNAPSYFMDFCHWAVVTKIAFTNIILRHILNCLIGRPRFHGCVVLRTANFQIKHSES